jgi:hypothetical protein
LALAVPTSRGSDHDDPVSHDRAIPAKARLMPAPSTRMRKSQAKAIDAPAPAATPLRAAITGLFIVASRTAIRL